MATTNGGAFNCVRDTIVINPDGSSTVTLRYTNVSTGALVAVRTLLIPVNQANAIIDSIGRTVSNSVPSGLASAFGSASTMADSTITNGAGAGKLDL